MNRATAASARAARSACVVSHRRVSAPAANGTRMYSTTERSRGSRLTLGGRIADADGAAAVLGGKPH
jgi:hypothetical protein